MKESQRLREAGDICSENSQDFANRGDEAMAIYWASLAAKKYNEADELEAKGE